MEGQSMPKINFDNSTMPPPASDPEQSSSHQSPPSTPAKPSSRKLLYLIGIITCIAIGFAVYDFIGTGDNNQNTPTPTPSLTPEIKEEENTEPTPTDVQEDEKDTPAPTTKRQATTTPRPTTNPVDSASGLDRSDLSVVVLNGSGKAGAASQLRDTLISLGYDVTSIGNADTQDYEKTVIETNESTKKYIDLLKKDLSNNYSIGSTSAEFFGTGARIIIGSE